MIWVDLRMVSGYFNVILMPFGEVRVVPERLS